MTDVESQAFVPKGGDDESAECQYLKWLSGLTSLVAIPLTIYGLVFAMIKFTDVDYVVVTDQKDCGNSSCSAYDRLMDMPADALIVDKNTVIFEKLVVGAKNKDDPTYTCTNVDGKTMEDGAQLYNPACVGATNGPCEESYRFAQHPFRIGIMWASIIAVILYEIAGCVLNWMAACGFNYNAVAVEWLAEQEVPHPKIALSVIEFIVGGVLITPSVLVTMFEITDHNPCLGVVQGASFSLLIIITNMFLILPVYIVIYAALAVQQDKSEEEKQQAEKMMKLSMAAMVAIAAFVAAYTMYIEVLGSPPLLAAQLLSAVSVYLSVADLGC